MLAAVTGCSLVNDPGRHLSGGPDAGDMDAGSDAGDMDAGSADAGSADAARLDAESADAGPLDGGPDAEPFDGGPDGSLDAGQLAPIDACNALAALNCAAYYGCCPGVPEPEPSERDECVRSLREGCELLIEPALTNSVTAYDRHLAAETLAEGQLLADECDPGYFQLARRQDGIVRVMRGTIAQGDECNAGTFVSTANLYSCLGGPAARCLRTGPTGSWTCGVPRTETMTCQHERDCADGLHCEGILPSTCRRNLGTGAACRDDSDCESLVCGTGEPRVCLGPADPNLFCTLAPAT